MADEDRSFTPQGADATPADQKETAATAAAVDPHKLGQRDNPQEDWGDAPDEGTVHSSNHSRRGEKTEAERGQGVKTRAHFKDIVSRRT